MPGMLEFSDFSKFSPVSSGQGMLLLYTLYYSSMYTMYTKNKAGPTIYCYENVLAGLPLKPSSKFIWVTFGSNLLINRELYIKKKWLKL